MNGAPYRNSLRALIAARPSRNRSRYASSIDSVSSRSMNRFTPTAVAPTVSVCGNRISAMQVTVASCCGLSVRKFAAALARACSPWANACWYDPGSSESPGTRAEMPAIASRNSRRSMRYTHRLLTLKHRIPLGASGHVSTTWVRARGTLQLPAPEARNGGRGKLGEPVRLESRRSHPVDVRHGATERADRLGKRRADLE